MRWPPASLSSCFKSLPSTSIWIQARGRSRIVYFQDILPIKLVYADARSCANNLASLPPSAPLTSTIRFIVFLLLKLAEDRGVEPRTLPIPTGSNRIASHLAVSSIFGAVSKNQTCGLIRTKDALYQLSYNSVVW